MKKIKGIIITYDPKSKKLKEIEIEADIDFEWDELRGVFYPWTEAKCPYDGEKIILDIIFKNDNFSPSETNVAGNCIHFYPSKFLSEEETDKMCDKIYTVEEGLMYVDMTREEFAEKMGWEIKWVGNPGNQYPIFVKKAEE